jgi:hypothetical protein
MSKEKEPIMSVVGNRPTAILSQLDGMDTAFVQCRLESGVDGWLPLSELCRLFADEIARQAKVQKGLSNE